MYIVTYSILFPCVLIISHYLWARNELKMFVYYTNLKKEHGQFAQVLNLIPDSVIIVSEKDNVVKPVPMPAKALQEDATHKDRLRAQLEFSTLQDLNRKSEQKRKLLKM